MNARAILFGIPVMVWSGNVFARDEGKVCAAAAEHAQTLKDRGKYAEARGELAVCLKDTCPTFVRDDCRVWMEELNRSQPMVVFSAHDERGSDLIQVRVLIDGTVLREKLDGKSVEVDPGEHSFRFEAAGYASTEQKVLVVQNVKNRVMDVVMKSEAADSALPTTTARDTSAHADSTSRDYTVPIVFGGVAVVGLGFFAFFEARGQGQKDEIENGCGATAARCSEDELAPARTSFRAAGVSLAVGAVGVAGAAASLWFAPKKSPVSVQASLGGASMRVRF